MRLIDILTENQQRRLVEAEPTEMANLSPDDTGLKYVIWIGEVGGQHGPRIKVSNIKGKFAKDDCFVVSVSKDPSVLTPKYARIPSGDLDDVLDWIKLNYEFLIELWKIYETGTGRTVDVLTKLKSI